MQTKIFGLMLAIIGALMMMYTGFNYVTTEKVVDLGPIKINKEKDHPIQWSPIIGGMLLVAGIVIIARHQKTSA